MYTMICCEDFKKILIDHKNLFQDTDEYGIILSWIELSKEKSFHKINNYGIKINYCPFCGSKV